MWTTKELLDNMIESEREIERMLWWPTDEDRKHLEELVNRPKIVWCAIKVKRENNTTFAMHDTTNDIMYKMNGYERTNEVYNKDEFIFDHYLTLMEL